MGGRGRCAAKTVGANHKSPCRRRIPWVFPLTERQDGSAILQVATCAKERRETGVQLASTSSPESLLYSNTCIFSVVQTDAVKLILLSPTPKKKGYVGFHPRKTDFGWIYSNTTMPPNPPSPDTRAMAPIPKIIATMQPRRAGASDSEPQIEPPLAIRALRSKNPAMYAEMIAQKMTLYAEMIAQKMTLYAEMIAQKMTLHRDYNSIKCVSQKCKACNTFYDHIDAKRQKRRLKSASDHEGQGADTNPTLKLGESAVDVTFNLQKVLGYLSTIDTMEELVGVAAATELSTCKRKLLEIETTNKQLEGQLKALRRQLNSQTSRKRPAEEDIDPRANKRSPESDGVATATLPISAADLANPDGVWDTLHNMPRPGPEDNYILLAQWLQHREVQNFPGILLKAPHFTVDLRDPRGHQQVFTRVPHHRHGNDHGWKRRRQRCILALLRILTVPGLYGSLIHQHNIPIHALKQLTPCDFPGSADEVDRLSKHEVATLLAKRGLTVVDADDLWQFCHRYVCAEFHVIGEGKSDFQEADFVEILTSEETAIKLRGLPPGLKPPQEDIYPRTVPGHRRPPASGGTGKFKKFGGRHHGKRGGT
ncbi:hypothetical protein C8F04DRAFT_1184304 [Mycena alexandri]|uniref:Uncharacterized protein n=1 Tax=Mycena alexandri TaxID=1745969 RepID=A0AAD6SSL7_9AGAR|nr:hypothetical protein C8F04DRAFT_1184304 [Mycena alexandri]